MTNSTKFTKFKWINIRLPYKLLLVYMPLILLPAMIVLYYVLDSYTTTSKQQTMDYTTDLLNLMGQKIDERVISFENLSKQIMTDNELIELVSRKASTTYEEFQIQSIINEKLNSIWHGYDHRQFVRAILIKTDSNFYTYGKSSITNYNTDHKDYIKNVANEKGGALWFEPESFSDGFQELQAFRLGRSIRNVKLHELGVITLVIDSRAITDIFEQTSLENGALKLINKDNEIIVDNGISFEHIEASELLSITQKRTHLEWSLTAELLLKELYEPIYKIVKPAILMLVICIALGLIVTQLLAQDLVIPIRKLMKNMKQGVRGVKPNKLQQFHGAIEIVEMNDTFISVMYEIEQLINEVRKQENKKKDAEIRVLQHQLSPHFLYNTLNSIRWMAIIQNQDNIKEMVDSLNHLLSYGLRGNEYNVPLKKDFEMLDYYIKIQQVRFQYFEFVKNIPFYLEEAIIPKFLLQPVIENAIIHGLSQSNRPGKIIVDVDTVDQNLILVVKDNGIGMSDDKINNIQSSLKNSDQHFGFHSVNERIQLHYGEHYQISIHSELGEGTQVTIKMPLVLQEKMEDRHEYT